MSALGIFALVLPLLGRTDVATGVQSTTRAGLIPQDAEQAAEPSADSALTLYAGVRTFDARSSFMLVYSPRLFFQVPGTIELGRPLVMQNLGASYRTHLTRRTNFSLDLSGGAGEVSYSYFNQEVTPGTSTVTTMTVPMFTLTSGAQLDHQTSRRNTVSAALDVGYQDQPEFLFPSLEVRSFPETYTAGLTLSDNYLLTQRDTVGLSLRGSYINAEMPEIEGADEPPPGELTTFGGLFSWRRVLSARSSLSVESGAEAAYTNETGDLSLIPTAVATHIVNWRGENQQWQQSTSGGVRGFYDQISATYRPQGFASWGIVGTFGRNWTSGFNAFGSTSLASDPLEPQQFETMVTFEQPNTYWLSPAARIQFGARSSGRASHLRDEDAVPMQWEALGFIDFRYTLGTGAAHGGWLR